MLARGGITPHFFQNLDAWEEVTLSHLKNVVQTEGQPTPLPEAEKCLLLIGPLSEIGERRLAERIQQVHPGLPVIAVGDSLSISDVVRVMRQGAVDVVDLTHEPNGFCQTVRDGLERGRQSEDERRRLLDLRRRLSLLTPAERQVLDAMMDGLANKETAKLLGIGLRTVELRRAKIMAKMGAKSVAELVKLFCQARCPGIDTRAQQNQ